MKPVLDWLAATALFVILIAWCVGCMTVMLVLANLMPLGDWYGHLFAVFAAGVGLWFALWSTARLTGHRV